MKRCAKILFWFIALLFVGLVVFISVEHFRGEWALRARLKELRTRGEKLNIADWVPAKVAPEQNAAPDLLALTNVLKPFFHISTDAPPIMHFVSQGRASISWQMDSWPVGKKTNTWSQFGGEIRAVEPNLDKLQSIWSKTRFDDGFDYSKGFVDYHSPPLLVFSKQTALLLSESAAYDVGCGDLTAASAKLHSLLVLVKDTDSQPQMICQLVRIACAEIAFGVTWEALQSPDWTDVQLAQIQSDWEPNEFSTPMERSYEMERNMLSETFREIRASHAAALQQIAGSEMMDDLLDGEGYSGLPTHGFVLHNIHLPLWQLAWSAQDELYALDRWQQIIASGRVAMSKSWLEARKISPQFKANAESYFPLLTSADEHPNWYDRCRFLFSGQPFSVNGAGVVRCLKIETQKNMVVAAIALKRYQLRHGKPAPELSALLPEFLSALPIDRMDGKPLRYHPNADGSFTLYSVGTNGTDDGGDPRLDDPTEKRRGIWFGKDAVWPVAVADEESGTTAKSTTK